MRYLFHHILFAGNFQINKALGREVLQFAMTCLFGVRQSNQLIVTVFSVRCLSVRWLMISTVQCRSPAMTVGWVVAR